MMKFFKSKITRAVAFILSVVIVFGVTFSFCSKIVGYATEKEQLNKENVYYDSLLFYNEFEEINSDLWLIAHMYLRNLDENGKLKGNEHYIKSINENMKKSGLMDEDGNIVYPETENFEYIVGFGDKRYSNSGTTEVDKTNNYAFWIENGSAGLPAYNSYAIGFDDKSLSDNGKGMEYYYSCGGGYAVFDYDTTGLDSYIDELGAVIYLNEDGTTPIPSNYVSTVSSVYYHSDYYEYEEIIESEDEGNSYKYPVTEQEEYESSEPYLNGYTIYISATPEHLAEFQEMQSRIAHIDMKVTRNIINLIGFAVIAILLMIFVFVTSGYNYENSKYYLNALDRIWAEIYLILLAAIPLITLIVIDQAMTEVLFLLRNMSKFVLTLTLSTGITAAYVIVCQCINTIIKRLKCKQLIRTSLIGKICIWTKNAVLSIGKQKNNIALIRFIILSVVMLILGFIDILFIFEGQSGVSEFMLVAFIVEIALYIYLNYRNLKDIADLSKHIENISNGDYTAVTTSNTSTIHKMTENLNNISDSIEKTVEKQVRSERMKIDLVTNVSHDLKTPLTSIISYVDLLAEEEMSEDARSYVTILENKTQRLQTIVADLFDLAKATSRTDVNLESLDLTVLTRQVIGEMEDKLKASGRELRSDISIDKAPVLADGKKLYRVLQNLLDNAMKYSLEGTRIYLKLYKENSKFIISIKNIASYEMTFTADEITERFVRGDKSRTDEGSGLGLSIAKSFSEACKGELEVKIEDDIFMVTVSFDEQE